VEVFEFLMRRDAMKRLVSFLAGLMLAVVTALAVASGPFKWTNVGGDPCNPKSGCTLEWALSQTGWPNQVKAELYLAMRTTAYTPIFLERGWRGWMTWGKYSPKFEKDTIADWPKGQKERASLWYYEDKDTRYNLIRFAECKNWGGWSEAIQAPLVRVEYPPASPVARVELLVPMDPGTLPLVVCLEE